jgi:beta-mannosidase
MYPLHSGWEFREVGNAVENHVPQWRPAAVPGDVHLDLFQNRLIPDPFSRDNVTHQQWIESAAWEYHDTIHVSPEMLNNTNIDLIFDGLDTDAQVTLNGTVVLRADNMFREWRVNIKPYLRSGDNTLTVLFPSSIQEASKLAAQDQWRNRSHAPTPEKTYLRKAAYEYGWDWGPRFVTSGLWRDVRIETWDKARISNLYVRQDDIHATVAHISAQMEVTVSTPCNAKIDIGYNEAGLHQSYSQNAILHTGVNSVTVPIEIVKPDLWYPAGYGAQPLYSFVTTVSCDGRPEDTASTRAGLRSVILRRDVDLWGRSFEFVVNGIPVFAKGASVIPFDSFPSRVTAADYKRILQAARDANMNMVRQWGGGYYETEEFYDLCDELGLMVWQDFMFGNEWQPGSYAFKQNVESEVTYQVRRLRNHPSIVLWCGNNETEASWRWPRTVEMTRSDPEIARHMWQNYLTLFSGVVAQTVERLNSETPFWSSSPSADYEDASGEFSMPDAKNLSQSQEYITGDMHNYAVHEPEDYEKYFPRFMSEYGWLSFPDMQTIKIYTKPADRTSISTPVMLAHQDGKHGNADILKPIVMRYGQPKDFDSLVYLSQVMQADWIKTGAEHLRRNRPRTMGSLFWQLNDCWPVASLSSIDYYGRWKALQYYARRFYSSILISPHVENGALAVYVVSDETAATPATVRLRIMKPDGSVLSEHKQTISIPRLSSTVPLRIPMQDIEQVSSASIASVFAAADIIVEGKTVSANLVYFVPERDLKLPKPTIRAELVQEGKQFQLRMLSNMLARSVYVSFDSDDVRLSDNYFDLLPGEERRIVVSGAETIQELQSNLKIMSEEDAIVSLVHVSGK